MTTTTSSTTASIDYTRTIPDVYKALEQVHLRIGGHGFDRKLMHLVVLRASQINQCAFCVRMHTREAREDGETTERLDRLVVWRHSSEFDARERAALAWVEALTTLRIEAEYAPLRAQLREHFSEEQISALTAAVAMINLWNRLQVANH